MKKPRRRTVSPVRVDLMELRDEAVEDCRSILALAELLEGCNADELHSQTISHTGGIIFHHAHKLYGELETLCQQLPKMK